ncbi:MAG: hypothetical protein U0446_04325 [Dehalococcoidia bacterium]
MPSKTSFEIAWRSVARETARRRARPATWGFWWLNIGWGPEAVELASDVTWMSGLVFTTSSIWRLVLTIE